MTVRVTVPDGLVEARRLALDYVPTDGMAEIACELVASADTDEVYLAATEADWLEVSTDGGVSWDALGTNPQAGLNVQHLIPDRGDRHEIIIRVVPQANFRQRRIGLLIGLGV